MAEDEGAERVVFTVGHSNHTLETFLELLRRHEIEVLVDTRSRPNSRYVPHFNHDALRPAVEQSGARFVFLGQELGGRPDGAEFYDAEGHVRYDRVAQTAEFLNGDYMCISITGSGTESTRLNGVPPSVRKDA